MDDLLNSTKKERDRTVKVKLVEVLVANQVLTEIAGEGFPVKISYAIGKLSRSLAKEADLIKEQINKLITRHGTPDESGQIWIKPEQKEAFAQYQKDHMELMMTETEVAVTPLSFSLLADYKGEALTPRRLQSLDPFIESET